MPKHYYYSRSNALCEKQVILEQEKELDLCTLKTTANGGTYLEQGDADCTLKNVQNGVKQMCYKESTIENIVWGQK
jgi:hypothetical protein